jgi:hypothetical protein
VRLRNARATHGNESFTAKVGSPKIQTLPETSKSAFLRPSTVVSEKIVPATSSDLIATHQIVECFAIRGAESKVDPPTASPQVAEANTEAKLAVALRATFHVMMRRAPMVMSRLYGDAPPWVGEASYGGAAGELLSGGLRRTPDAIR